VLVQKRMDQEQHKQQKIQPKLSEIFKEKIVDIPQTFGSFVSENGEKYCAVSALMKYLGHDVSSTMSSSITIDGVQNDKININLELIPSDILEMIENFAPCTNITKYPPKCFCSKSDYYYCYSLVSLLIHLNDYHKMNFMEIGIWLETKGI
jgi:hypothetical protein